MASQDAYAASLAAVFFRAGAQRAVQQLQAAAPAASVADTIGLLPSESGSASAAPPDPEDAFGQHVGAILQRERLAAVARRVLDGGRAGRQLSDTLRSWLANKDDAPRCSAALAFADQWLVREAGSDADIRELHSRQAELPKRSRWIVVADSSVSAPLRPALHLVVSSGRDVKLLVCASVPAEDARSRHGAPPVIDAGLYALNYGDVYVVSGRCRGRARGSRCPSRASPPPPGIDEPDDAPQAVRRRRRRGRGL